MALLVIQQGNTKGPSRKRILCSDLAQRKTKGGRAAEAQAASFVVAPEGRQLCQLRIEYALCSRCGSLVVPWWIPSTTFVILWIFWCMLGWL